ncbi:MAG: phenylalanyl-tRNA synthetase alpha chain [Chloroflexota bacterium]|jgi:phenylalanyl-tRNA synthetase alpha chain|nr:phenylalanyl-tRNA synthetase alpha chain [Chloroflexota bacterium]
MDLASLLDRLTALRQQALPSVEKADDPDELDAVEATYLGRNGELRKLLANIGQLSAEDRPKVGAAANPIREELEGAIATRRARLESIALDVRLAREKSDVTLPGRALPRGALHPLAETSREIARIFGEFGFVTYDGPEVETDELNFQLLNMPADHPARDLWDTLYVAGTDRKWLLRTHTSPGQMRLMRANKPPIRALSPGRCYRYEAVDASHGFEFFQVEGLMVDEGTTMAHLRGLLDEFAHAMFGAGTGTRFRPGYYPFTEPSVAFDISCTICGGVGCAACKRTGWLTILGAGMVHPVVLRNGGIDPERYQGFAFGMGIDRITMLRHGIPDIRAFFENDMRFLEAF